MTYQVIKELLESQQIRGLSKEVSQIGEVQIYNLEIPSQDSVNSDLYRLLYSIFGKRSVNDSYLRSKQYDDRLVLLYYNSFRVRGYYGSGYLEYRDLARAYKGKTEISSIEEANTIVQKFISEYDLLTLDTENQLKYDNISYIKSHGSSRNGEETEIVTNNLIVNYNRSTDNINWIGPGSYISAMIEKEDVVGFNRFWRKLISKHKMVKLIPIEDALKNMINDLSSRLDNKKIKSEDIILEKAEFGYYGCNRRTPQKFLQPAYIFEFRTTGKFSFIYDFVQLAHNKPFERIDIEPKLLEEQKNKKITNPRS